MNNELMDKSPCENMANDGVVRTYKEIKQERILDIDKLGIIPIGTDEIFVLIEGSNTHYISNYGRCIEVTDKEKLLKGYMNRQGKLIYSIPIWRDKERIDRSYSADRLVVDTFIDYDKSKGQYIWHSGYDKEDCYFRNLYPMEAHTYKAIKTFVLNGGFDTEQKILEVMNGEAYNMPTVLGVGYWGSPDVDTKHWTYRKWHNMLTRCYSDSCHKNQPNYIDCTVCPKWHNYSNFKEWAEANYYTIDEATMELDKDILIKGNTVYSPDTCVFVPRSINLLVINVKAARGEQPLGVFKFNDKYVASMSYNGKQIRIGQYDTPEEAFEKYKEYKEKFLKDIAEQYKDKIPVKLYEALVNWQVEITD